MYDMIHLQYLYIYAGAPRSLARGLGGGLAAAGAASERFLGGSVRRKPNPWGVHGFHPQKPWENHGKKPWKNHGKSIRNLKKC